ncbi:TOMM precursor leader peptide-binding protein [Nonomuraea sp. NN258]|uniref:TOMM precursor leader peptide-binding protein n=1 Tax=Nonomuraea antri TaxID=2730852 RepID=UPI00156833D5|nr:TOMM precursor leader peptide-binding protein [Nonomuraea antri]NRQ35497.1 TOMM precursor leader peptide-binding protein [Nonomuraea antri]
MALRELVRCCARDPIDRRELITLAARADGVTEAEADAAITTLLTARILVEEDDVALLTGRGSSSRQALFFSMFQPAPRAAAMIGELAGRTVAVLGVGGIGGSVALQLATAGVGRLRLVDHDDVEESNLHRQFLYTAADVGAAKVTAAARSLAEHSPRVDVESRDLALTGPADVADAVAGADLAIATADSPQPHIRRWMNAGCLAAGVPFLPGGFSQHLGIAGPLVVPGRSACLACLEEHLRAGNDGRDLPDVLNQGRTVPAFGPLCSIVAGILATEAVGFLTGAFPPALLDTMVYFNLLTMQTARQPVPRTAGCPACGRPGGGAGVQQQNFT